MDNKWLADEGNTLLKCSTEAKGQIESRGDYIKVAYEAFKGCDQITKVTLPSSVTSIGAAAFTGCTNLVTIDLSATHLVFLPEALFDNCKNLQRVYLPDTIREIGDFAFRGCTRLKQIKLPDSIQRIGEYAFAGCSSLMDVTNIHNKVDVGQMAFAGCISLRQINFPIHNTKVPYGMFLFCKSLERIQLGENIDMIEAHVFDGCLSLHHINLPNVYGIGAYAFRNCVSLENIELGDKLEDIELCAFNGCKNLHNVRISNIDIDWMGSDISLIRDTLSNLGIELIENGFFDERTRKEDNEQNDNGVTHPHALEAEEPLQVKSIVLSSNSDVITQDDVESICYEKNVKYKITIPDGIRHIDNDAFACCNIEDIEIPESVIDIGENAFNNTELSVFKCPKGITKIGSGTYAGNNINVVVIPKHINYIGEYAFNANPIEIIIIKNPDCEICQGAFSIGDSLKELHLKNCIPPKNIMKWFWNDVPADRRPEDFSDCVLYVPKGTAYLYYGYNEQPEYDIFYMDASWDYSNPYLFFKDIVEE